MLLTWTGILEGSAPGGSHLQDPAPFAREIIGRHTASHPMTVLGPLIQAPVTTIKAEEPQAILTFEKHKVIFLINTRARIAAIPFSPGPRSSKKITVQGMSSL
jgi:hypothetical protein